MSEKRTGPRTLECARHMHSSCDSSARKKDGFCECPCHDGRGGAK